MQPRPIRSQIYLPVLRFGITDEDWGFVIVAAVAGYGIPFLFGMKIGSVPLEMVGWVVAAGLTILVLNIVRRKSRPAWLRHVIRAKLQGGISRRRLPGDAAHGWLKQDLEKE
jgi:hypothetical protein